MRFAQRGLRDEAGLSLVEVLAALTIFSIVTVGVVPLLASSLRGATLGRSTTVAKNVAVRAMERVRGLPYTRSVSTTVTLRKIDVLDLFFPCAPGTSAVVVNPCSTTGTEYVFSGTLADPLRPTIPQPAGTFVTTCTPTALANPACPRSLPEGYLLRYDAQFVKAGSASPTSPETYSVLNSATVPAVPTTYNWNATTTESPPSQILKIRISVSWLLGGDQKLFELDSLVADRKFGIEKIAGVARVDHTVRVLTTYREGLANTSELVATVGTSATGVTSRVSALADQSVDGGQVTLIRQSDGATPATPLIDPPVAGARAAYVAPPDQTTIPDPAATAPATIVAHPSQCQDPALTLGACPDKQAAYLGTTHAKGLSVATGSDLPTASGSILFSPLSTTTFELFVDAQRNADTTSKNPLQLLNNLLYTSGNTIEHPLFAVRPDNSVASNVNCLPTAVTPSCRSMNVTTSAATGPLSSGRRVETTATAGLAQVRLFPVNFIPGAAGASKAVIRINNFTARVNCKATGSSTTADVSATWSATFEYFKQSDDNDGRDNGSYQTMTLNNTDFATKIQALKNANPMVYEVPEVTPVKLPQGGDVYLFPTATNRGYLTDLTGGLPVVTKDNAAGQTAAAQIAGALTLTTSAVDPDFSQSTMNVVLGALSCSAADRRT